MSSHTKGPWAVLQEESDKPYIRVRGTVLGGRYKVANVLSVTYEGAADREAQETRANAYLIAAAPAMLEALRRIEMRASSEAPCEELEDVQRDLRHIHATAVAAIAKATGEQQ
jgi:hypothetical protein